MYTCTNTVNETLPLWTFRLILRPKCCAASKKASSSANSPSPWLRVVMMASGPGSLFLLKDIMTTNWRPLHWRTNTRWICTIYTDNKPVGPVMQKKICEEEAECNSSFFGWWFCVFEQMMQLVNQIIYGNIYEAPEEGNEETHQQPQASQSLREGVLLLHRGGLASFRWVKYACVLITVALLFKTTYIFIMRLFFRATWPNVYIFSNIRTLCLFQYCMKSQQGLSLYCAHTAEETQSNTHPDIIIDVCFSPLQS